MSRFEGKFKRSFSDKAGKKTLDHLVQCLGKLGIDVVRSLGQLPTDAEDKLPPIDGQAVNFLDEGF